MQYGQHQHCPGCYAVRQPLRSYQPPAESSQQGVSHSMQGVETKQPSPDAVAHVPHVAARGAALQNRGDVQVKVCHVRVLLQAHHGAHVLAVDDAAQGSRVGRSRHLGWVSGRAAQQQAAGNSSK